jgi:peptidoglycan/LPS O-acetylase OafA/YrhL
MLYDFESIVLSRYLMNIDKPRRLLELDALRGIASMSVVCFHFGMKHQVESHQIFNFGVTGVELFFIISGFVILMTLEKTKNWKDFMISRVSRLYPAYWVCVTITAILHLIDGKLSPELARSNLLIEYPINLTMLQRWTKIPDLDGTYWTLSLELIFYVFMLVVFSLRQLKNIEVIGGVGLITAVLFKGLNLPGVVEKALPIFGFYPLFYAGILLYKIKFDRITFPRYVLVLICMIIQYIFHLKIQPYAISNEQYGLMLTIYTTLFFLFVNDWLKFIVNKVTIFLGEISYSLYLVHSFLSVNIIIPGLMKYAHINFWLASFGVALPISMIIAVLINRKIEKPVMAIIRSAYRSGKFA